MIIKIEKYLIKIIKEVLEWDFKVRYN